MRKDKAKEKSKARHKKSAYQELAEEIIRPAKEKREAKDKLRAEAKSAFDSLPRKIRNRIRKIYADKGQDDEFTVEAWLLHGDDKWAKRARRARQAQKESKQWKGFGDFLKASKQKRIKIKDIDPAKDKRIAKEVRQKMIPAPPKNPYAALMIPMVIVPDDPNAKVVIADAGSIIRLADQSTLYRERVSPITRRADEILVHYGKAKSPTLGWITQRSELPPLKVMKPSKGPTFLVTTRDENSLNAWEQFRLKVARTRKSDPNNWIARWLATHGSKYPRELREVTRLFGGKPIKNEGFEARCTKLFTLILNTELDMASAKKGKNKKSKKGKAAVAEKSSKKSKKNKKAKLDTGTRITTKHDNHIIKRLVKENPRRAGSAKAKIWDKLKKGMTVGTFVEKGGSRASVGRYIQNGWVKLLKPKGGDDE